MRRPRAVLSRLAYGIGIGQVRVLRGRVRRLESDLVEHGELQRLLGEEVDALERKVARAVRVRGHDR